MMNCVAAAPELVNTQDSMPQSMGLTVVDGVMINSWSGDNSLFKFPGKDDL